MDGTVYKSDGLNEWLPWNDHTKVWYSDGKTSVSFKEQVRQIQPDVLFVVGLFDPIYNILPVFFSKAPKVIVSVRGMLHPQALSQKSMKKKLFISLLRRLCRNDKLFFHATTELEQQYVHEKLRVDKDRIYVAGNYPSFLGKQRMPRKQTGILKLVSIALISPMKNILEVIRALNSVNGNVQYDIYGAVKDMNYWAECETAIQLLRKNIEVNCKGILIPSKVPDVLAQYHVFILPSKSENFGHAIFEALSSGRPVITSHGTPFNELSERESGLNVASTERELSGAVNFFLQMNESELMRWSDYSVAYAREFMDSMHLKEGYDRMFL